MKKGKQPGEFKKQQTRHKARQALYDAFKQMRELGESICMYQQKQYKLIDPITTDLYCGQGFVKFGRNIELCHLYEKDGIVATSQVTDRYRKIQPDEIIAICIEV